ncbi:tRNA (Gm18) ribose methylase trm3p superfamily SPOUT methylase [Cryptosporidium xiaoi]|uniref:tRNA (Gm18) ribose methylase trm3p superfamily SPOUT methylase n=1 Tax=Cryptosporidium xiaoi TaxID=659607 RepID=A0AAV9XTP1_9CRYT
MKNKIKEIIDVIDKKEIPESSLTDALDLCLNIYFLSFTEPDTKKLIRDEILLLIEDTNYDLSPKKYLIYFYFLKYTSDDGNWSLNDVVLYNFFKNLRFIKSEIILNQIYGVIITILLPNPDKINIIFNIWESIFLSESDNFLEFKSLTKMIHFICSKLFCETNVHPYLKDINNNIINIFYKSYKKRTNFCSDTRFLAKIEYSQNLLFPLLIKHYDFIERASKSEFIDTITKLFEDTAYFRFSVFTLRIPNLIELIIDSGYTFDSNEIKEMLYNGITNQEQEVRKSTKFILEKIENKIGKLYNTSTKTECCSNNLNSFLCILDCYENFSIHLLKTNWEKFKSLMSNMQDINREWWVKSLIKMGLNHQNLNVQRFIAFNTINFCIERSNFLPIWMTKELFLEIYLKYILSSLNNRISLQIEELFVKFIYIILKKNKEWISEYLIFISKTVLSFTPFRIMIYPLTIGALHEYDFNSNNDSHPKNEYNLAKFLEVDYNLLSETNLELTKRYGFEFNIEFKDSIKIQKECFIELLDISIVIIKYIPIIMRHELYFLWIKIILNYLNYHEFIKKDLITKLIQLLGIIPEYLYHGKINHIVEYFVKSKNIYIDTSVSPQKLFEKSNRWYLILQYGIGFGRLKKILCIKSSSISILENDIIFISSYYNNEEVDKIDINIEKKIEYIYSNIKLLLEDSQECKNIDIDLLWFYTHTFSLISERDKDNLLLNKLFDWCIENIIQIDTLLEKMKRSVYCLISVIFIIKCMIHLQKYMNFASDETCVQVINNLMVITSNVISKLTINNKTIKSWDCYRINCCKYDIFDVNSVNNDKYCIIYSSKLIIGNPDKYLPEMNKGHINRLIQLFPGNLREFISTFSKLKFMFIDICVLKNIMTLSNSILKKNIIYWKLLSDNNSREIFSQVSGSIWNWHEHFFALILYELNNFGTEDFYLWKLVEYSFIQISKNYLMFQKTIVSEYLNKIFELIKKHCVELIDKSIYNDLLITKLNSILTNNDFISLFKETNIFEDVINFYYNKILFNNNETRFFIFPLLNFVYLFIKGCSENIISSLFQNIVSNKECSLSNEERRIIKVSNVILELLIFEEKGLIDGYNLRFQKVDNNDKLELNKIFELYKKCKIFEDYNSFIRHSTIIYLYNSIQISSENYNKNHLFFVQLVIFLLTLKLDNSIPTSVEEGLALNGTNFYKKNCNLDTFVENKYSTNKNSNKFPPLPNSVQHKLLINIWQSLCCFIDALKSNKTEFNLYILEFYFRHLCYLYNPDIRQYMDLFGCNVVILFPSFCIKYLAQGLSSNVNNHTQVIYSLLTVSSYLIYYLRKKTPFVYNENILKDTDFKDEFFVHKGINWIKFEKKVLDNYIMFFNIFLSYYTSNSSLLRNIVLLTLYLLYKNDSVSLLVDDSNQTSLFSNGPQRYSISNIIDQALSTNNFESIIELFENSGHSIRNEMSKNKPFLVNSMIIEESIGLREVIRNIVRNKDTKKMLENLDKIWRLWKPKRYCSLENIIPNDNIIEFTDQKVSQSFFNTCQAFDPILSALEESNQEGDDEFQELIAFQDRNDEFLLNSHLIFGDLRPSWSLYYLLKKVICNEMSKNYHESPKLQEVRIERTPTPRNDYQLKFEPETAPRLLSEELRPKRLDLFGEDRTELIVIASLLDKIPNIAGLTRTCEIFRVKELLINTKKTLSDPMFKQISVTAEKWLPINELSPERISEYINIKRLEGYGIYGLEQTSSSIPLKDFEFPKKSILILGREDEGIPSDIVSIVDHCIEIPQFGMIRSLNVHVSASIFIHEYTTQVLNLT